MISSSIGIWIGAILCIIMTSILFKQSRFYRFAEAIFIGSAAGNSVVYAIKNVNEMGIGAIAKGDWSPLVAFILGVLFFTRLIPVEKFRWPSRYPVAMLTGLGMGLAFRSVLIAQVIEPIASSMLPLFGVSIQTVFESFIVVLLTGTTLMYFIFTRPDTGTIGRLTQIGRYGMMIAFGQAIGSKVVTFAASYLGVVSFWLFDWLGLR